ncbi:MAG TPA: cysteine--tRNA ligase [Clostridiales bacterium]|nr:cysteine--tRNA ligase [Clostridiales bacterium]
MKVYNSMTRTKEELVPLKPGKVGIYACGPTVYDYFHIGNARMFITFDLLRRYLEHRGYEVTYVQNFTDVDDKMIARAQAEGITVAELAEQYIAAYFEDAQALGIRPATVHPRATEHIEKIIELIQELENKGLAYPVDGDMYYDTTAFPDYGRLSGQNLDDLDAGARVDVDEGKRHPADFALWKAEKPGEPAWDSPWGRGRPGWHIECSAMSMTYLGETFDIHCGGQDLMFPHHENEIAQSEGATGQPFVRYWMHNGFLNIDNRKMSKSLGNFFTVRDILKEYEAEDIRMFMLSAHYRSPLNFSREMMAQARAGLMRLYTARDRLDFLLAHAHDGEPSAEEQELIARAEAALPSFYEAMDDDLNTAGALGVMFELVYDINTVLAETSSRRAVEAARTALLAMADVLGLLVKKADALPSDIQALVDERAQARTNRDWKKSDALRDELIARGYTVEDTKLGQKITKAV